MLTIKLITFVYASGIVLLNVVQPVRPSQHPNEWPNGRRGLRKHGDGRASRDQTNLSDKYMKLFACEGHAVNISCRSGTHINLIRANFGRFSITICNDDGNVNMKVNCICERKQECSINATVENFGDGCPGNSKYLEVHYRCVPGEKQPNYPTTFMVDTSNLPSLDDFVLRRNPSTKSSPTTLITPTSKNTVMKDNSNENHPTASWPESGFKIFQTHQKSPSKATSMDTFKSSSSTPSSSIASFTFSLPHSSNGGSEKSTSSSSRHPIVADFNLQPTSKDSTLASAITPKSISSNTSKSVDGKTEATQNHWKASSDSNSVGKATSRHHHHHVSHQHDNGNVASSQPPSVPIHQSMGPSETPLFNQSQLCSPGIYRGLFWNWTLPGRIVRQKCPPLSEGMAEWRCSDDFGQVMWLKSEPDLSACKSNWVTKLEEQMKVPESSLMHHVYTLASHTESKILHGGDVMPIIGLISELIRRVRSELGEHPVDKQNQFAKDILIVIQRISSNLVEMKQKDCWSDLPPPDRTLSAANLLSELEQIGKVFLQTCHQPEKSVRVEDNLYMALHSLPMESLSEHGLDLPIEPISPSSSTTFSRQLRSISLDSSISSASIHLPPLSYGEFSHGGLVKMGFAVYSKMNQLLDPEDDLNRISDSNYLATVINSEIVSLFTAKDYHRAGNRASLDSPPIPVEITFRHLIEGKVSNIQCAYWLGDRWMTSRTASLGGCYVLESNRTHTKCECDHINSYAILVDITREEEPSTSRGLMFHYIVQIGCMIASVFLGLSLITFLLFKNLRTDQTCIHTNLCLCLLVVQIIFILGIDETNLGIICSIIACLLHYFLMSIFMWMLIEGLHLYLMLIEVFEPDNSRLALYFILSYGIPFIDVLLTVIFAFSSYMNPTSCWMDDKTALWSLVIPVLIITMSNVLCLIIAQFTISRTMSSPFIHKEVKHQEKVKRIRSWIRGSLIQILLVGLCWTLGILYLFITSLIMAYAFAMVNVLQAVFIFMYQCASNAVVRHEYGRFFGQFKWCLGHRTCGRVKGTSLNIAQQSTANQALTGRAPFCRPTVSLGHPLDQESAYIDSRHEAEEPIIRSNCGSALKSTLCRGLTSPATQRYHLESQVVSRNDNEESAEHEALMIGDGQLRIHTQSKSPLQHYYTTSTLRADASRFNGDHFYECIPDEGYSEVSGALPKNYQNLNVLSPVCQHFKPKNQYEQRHFASSTLKKRNDLSTKVLTNGLDHSSLSSSSEERLNTSKRESTSCFATIGGHKSSASRYQPSTGSPRVGRRLPQPLGNKQKAKNVYAKLHGTQIVSSAISDDL